MNRELYDLTNPQKNILATELYYNNTSINNVGGTVYLKAKLHFDILQKAVANVLKNNDNFHTRITKEKNEVKQYFEYDNYIPEILNIKNLHELHRIESDLCLKTFDLFSENRLFETKIFKLPNGYGGVIVIMHHIISDSWTLGLYCKEIVNEYQLLLDKNSFQGSGSFSTPFSYRNFIKEEAAYLKSASFEKDKKYWDSVFETVPEVATLPATIKRKNNKITCSALRQSFSISKQTALKILDYCRRNKISVYNFLMTIYSIYIGRVSNLTDFVIGTPILNRSNYSDKNTNGMFVSTVPLRINIDESSTFIDF